ncbi:MAG: hypothetical protein AAFY29_20605 [Pseudomonadota bacterium]
MTRTSWFDGHLNFAKTHWRSLSVSLLVALSPQVSAQSEEGKQRTFFAELEAGAEYDSVVSLDELDLSADTGDQALLIDASVGVEQPLGSGMELDLRYTYSVLDYQDISEVDQNSHILSGDLKKKLGGADIGLSGFYVNADLDDESFLELARVSPYVSGFFTKGWFARAGYVYSDKSNDVNPGRDAMASIGEIDIYHFPPGKPWFFNIGYKYRDEDASAARFDYTGDTFKARWVQRMTLWDRKARFELGFRRLDRDYSSVTPSIGEKRFDQRDRTQAQLEVALTERLDLEFYYNYSDWESNLESVDFHQHVAGFRFRYRWES